MRLYQTPGGVWTGTEKNHNAALKAEGLKPADMPRKQVDVPTDKPGLLEFLTFHNVNVINPQAPLGVDVSAGAPTPLASAETTVPGYASPFDARTVVAGIDAGLCSQAIAQMDGVNLGKVVKTTIERMAQLAKELPVEA